MKKCIVCASQRGLFKEFIFEARPNSSSVTQQNPHPRHTLGVPPSSFTLRVPILLKPNALRSMGFQIFMDFLLILLNFLIAYVELPFQKVGPELSFQGLDAGTGSAGNLAL
jgi:hypothetical protein